MEKSLSQYDCASHKIPEKIKKIRFMRPAQDAGTTVGTKRAGNRKGGKVRGMKSGKQKQRKVNVSALVAKTKKG